MSDILKESIKKAIKKEYLKSRLKSIIAENVKVLVETKMKVIRSKFQDLLSQNKITSDEYNLLFKKDGTPVGPFKHKIFAEMVYQTLMAGENHMLSELVDSFSMFKEKIIDKYNRKQLKDPRIPGTSLDRFPILQLIESESLTFDEYNKYLNILNQTNARSSVLQKVLDNGLKGDKSNFEVIYKGRDWIIAYPKTYLGSIATARMGPDGTYYTPPDTIGEMNWCTSVDSANNMFLNYHRQMNLHMYYFTKVNGFGKSDPHRKLCISFLKNLGDVQLAFGSASVDGNNSAFKEKSEILRIIGNKLFETIFNDAKRPERLEIDQKSYYESISAPQYKNLRKAAGMDEGNLELFAREVEYYLEYSKNPELLSLIFSDSNRFILKAASHNYGQVKDSNGTYFKMMLESLIRSSDTSVRDFWVVASRLFDFERYRKNIEIPNKMIKEILSHRLSSSVLVENAFRVCKNIQPDDIAKYILNNKNQEINTRKVASSLARNQNTSAENLLLIMRFGFVKDYDINDLLKNNSVNEEIIKYFCKDLPKSVHTLCKIAKHPKMTQENFSLLWDNWFKSVSKMRTKYIADQSAMFLIDVIKSPFVTDKIIDEIIEKGYMNIKEIFAWAAKNKKIGESYVKSVIQIAFKDKDGTLIRTLSKDLPSEKHIRFLYNVYKENRTSDESSIFRHQESPILLGIAQNDSAPVDILKRILAEPDPHGIYAFQIANNIAAPPIFLARCLKNYKKDPDPARRAAGNISTPILSLLKFAKADSVYFSRDAFITAVKASGKSFNDYPNTAFLPELCADLGYDYEKL